MQTIYEIVTCSIRVIAVEVAIVILSQNGVFSFDLNRITNTCNFLEVLLQPT